MNYLMYQSYVGSIEFDVDAQIFHGNVVGIQDVVTFEGTCLEDVKQAFHESVDDYLAFCLIRGEEANIPK